ncbi:hypothetical protein D8B22_18205 [Verminephrobacter aporrectodeae subsp. tuberculatae]|nr:hypothetical protein [Verminephrobacter aporrectodeae subsp. tuberculatae]MCW8170992.1 hypothetical protein [Verminephrobacter aporrectodeae subsp. tuberculatae]
MSELKRASESDILIRLRPGQGQSPIYFVHPTHGNGLCYGPLAVMLGNKHPFYAIQSAGLLPDSDPDQTIEQMAQRYVERILMQDSEGPYLLGGWSQGALIAVEMAQILKSTGRKVDHLFAIDNMFITVDDRAFQAGKGMQAGARWRQFQPARQVRAHRVRERVVAFRVEPAHAPDVRREMPLGDELGEHRLQVRGNARGERLQAGAEKRNQRRRRQYEAQPQRRKNGFAEAADVDHPPAEVQFLERGQRLVGDAEIAGPVVLDDPRVGRLGGLEQREAPIQAHLHAQRLLLRRGDGPA